MRIVVALLSLIVMSCHMPALAQGAGSQADPALIDALAHMRQGLENAEASGNFAASGIAQLVKANNFLLIATAGTAIEEPAKTASTPRTAKRHYNSASRSLRKAVDGGVWNTQATTGVLDLGLDPNASRADVLRMMIELAEDTSLALEDALLGKDVQTILASAIGSSGQIAAAIAAFNGF